MLEHLKKTGTQVPAEVTLPKPSTSPTGETLTVEQPVTGVIRTRQANIIERVGWTLAQAFVGAFVTALFASQKLGLSGLKAAGLAGGSAVLAALASLVKNLIATKNEG